MPAPVEESDDLHLTLVQSGPTYRLGKRLGLTTETHSRRMCKIALFICVTWVPLLGLSLIGGRATGGVEIPFFHDPEVSARFLCVMPLLEIAQFVVAISLSVHGRHFVEMGLVSSGELPKFEAAKAVVMRWREWPLIEAMLLIAAFVLSIGLRVGLGLSNGDSSWERAGGGITAAGWWYILVSLPILYFFLFRWIWVFSLWGSFLFLVARVPLKLTATHPDHLGGLGFISWGIASFSLVLAAVSTVFSAGLADEILHHGHTLSGLKYHVAVFVVGSVLAMHLPLLAFSPQLSRCRFRGLLEFGAFVWRHDQAFDEKWIRNTPDPAIESLLGSPDVQSLADIATCYEHVNEMRILPYDSKAVVVLLLAALLPMCPLVATQIPLTEILMKLGEVLI